MDIHLGIFLPCSAYVALFPLIEISLLWHRISKIAAAATWSRLSHYITRPGVKFIARIDIMPDRIERLIYITIALFIILADTIRNRGYHSMISSGINSNHQIRDLAFAHWYRTLSESATSQIFCQNPIPSPHPSHE